MKTQTLNLFIVDDNQLMVTGLQHYLENRFGTDLNISSFCTGASALKYVDDTTNIVILDYFLQGENGNEVLKSIKQINPKTEVIMLSNNEDMGIAIVSFRNGATDYVIKGEKSFKKITSLVYKIISYPVRVMIQEFGINKYIAIFTAIFVVMGIGIYLSLKFIH